MAVFLDFTVPRCGIHLPWCLPPSSRTASRGGSPSPVGCEGMPAKHRRAGVGPVACRPLPVGPSPVAPARSTSNQVRSRWLNAADRSASNPVSRATRINSVGSTAATLPCSLVRLPARTASVAGLSAIGGELPKFQEPPANIYDHLPRHPQPSFSTLMANHRRASYFLPLSPPQHKSHPHTDGRHPTASNSAAIRSRLYPIRAAVKFSTRANRVNADATARKNAPQSSLLSCCGAAAPCSTGTEGRGGQPPPLRTAS